MRTAVRTSDADLYHDWRKRAKDHWSHVRLLSGLWQPNGETREEDLHELESSLGEDHNLNVLCSLLSHAQAEFGGQHAVKLVLAAAGKEQKRLRGKAAEHGTILYGMKGRAFVDDFESRWHRWQSQKAQLVVIAKNLAMNSY